MDKDEFNREIGFVLFLFDGLSLIDSHNENEKNVKEIFGLAVL